ncbi:hypothetical protein GC194_01340 [bacterium]|nr:hypothetical protein [bacterium]
MSSRVTLKFAFVCMASTALLFLNACGDKDPVDKPSSTSKGMYVLNEGGFQKGNASISFINTDDNTLQTKLYETANKQPLGDVGNALNIINDKLYVVVNNSGLIRVLDKKTYVELATIEGFTSPRQIVAVNEKTAYVSDLFANKLSVVDLTTNKISQTVKLHGSTEKMVVSGNELFVTNGSTNYVYVVNTESATLVDSIDIGGNSNEIWLLNGKPTVIRNANTDNKVQGAVLSLNAAAHNIESSVAYNYTGTLWTCRSSLDNGNIYFLLDQKVMKYDGKSISNIFSVDFTAYNMYCTNGTIWLCDAKDYQQTGTVSSFAGDGTLKNSFNTGIIPSVLWYVEL